MRIVLSDHLQHRLTLRRIPKDLPKRVYLHAKERYYDEKTHLTVAVKAVILYGKTREVMVAYRTEGTKVRLITVHPLKKAQRENRIKSMRWRKLT